MTEKTNKEILQEQIDELKKENQALKTTVMTFNAKFEEMEKKGEAKSPEKPSMDSQKPQDDSHIHSFDDIRRHKQSCPAGENCDDWKLALEATEQLTGMKPNVFCKKCKTPQFKRKGKEKCDVCGAGNEFSEDIGHTEASGIF